MAQARWPFMYLTTRRANDSPRLRMNLDLRNSLEVLLQRMLKALEPGTIMLIHRHHASSETVVICGVRFVGSSMMTTVLRQSM